MQTKDGKPIIIRRLNETDVQDIYALMLDVLSRLPSQDLFAMYDEAFITYHLNEHGEIYGAYVNGNLVAYSVISYPDKSDNLGPEFGVPVEELSHVAVLDSTVVHESVRGMGLQRYFHRLREERARKRGCLYLYSTVHPDNLPSVRNLDEAGLTLQFTRPMYGGKMRHCYAKRL
ncbi:putative GNAT superfamily acetyltransferase [Paenibacillus cellulosilyticus]|uniref:Putative GNAT superfamily acetyltransferase n=1 Tax=Paenibacillus cellulosilyticus TaxID=375489 RepID=A0A2V2YTV6_9BACL|nr:GNAT family N-acetyltransferase [Paenibacillus cellulosilyticus]PWW02933.1 putative GNAT superfamily acetyltransferase [Paenibacillus cellulosilyticus]QKS45841.1 GNAT family N-acetyltransferase [Paenibacillus cellulosilyticus]